MSIEVQLKEQAKSARIAARQLAIMSTNQKNYALQKMADALEQAAKEILLANDKDLANGILKGLNASLLDRLKLNEERIKIMADGLRQVALLPDPIGTGISRTQRPNGLVIQQLRVPLGVIGIIYEARPNVTVDAAGLCLKSGNAVILRGGSEAVQSNLAIIEVLQSALLDIGMPKGCVEFIAETDHEVVHKMIKMNDDINVIIPRGGAKLIQTVVQNSTVPVIETGVGVCHVFVDENADVIKAEEIVMNAKISRPAVCNALETLLVHEKIADTFIPQMLERLFAAGVEVRGCEKTVSYHTKVIPAQESDWRTEYGTLILSVKIVKDIEEAIAHIDNYSTKHSEAIITESYSHACKFQQEVDSAVVYVNASTRFTDGFEFGFGAEIGISTQKLHARGPMGLEALTTSKYLVCGDGQIR